MYIIRSRTFYWAKRTVTELGFAFFSGATWDTVYILQRSISMRWISPYVHAYYACRLTQHIPWFSSVHRYCFFLTPSNCPLMQRFEIWLAKYTANRDVSIRRLYYIQIAVSVNILLGLQKLSRGCIEKKFRIRIDYLGNMSITCAHLSRRGACIRRKGCTLNLIACTFYMRASNSNS